MFGQKGLRSSDNKVWLIRQIGSKARVQTRRIPSLQLEIVFERVQGIRVIAGNCGAIAPVLELHFRRLITLRLGDMPIVEARGYQRCALRDGQIDIERLSRPERGGGGVTASRQISDGTREGRRNRPGSITLRFTWRLSLF